MYEEEKEITESVFLNIHKDTLDHSIFPQTFVKYQNYFHFLNLFITAFTFWEF